MNFFLSVHSNLVLSVQSALVAHSLKGYFPTLSWYKILTSRFPFLELLTCWFDGTNFALKKWTAPSPVALPITITRCHTYVLVVFVEVHE